MSRWSSKPADDKLARARINQRRHRDRVKNRIADLEFELEKTKTELRVALQTIVHLSAKLDSAVDTSLISQAGRSTATRQPRAKVSKEQPASLAVSQLLLGTTTSPSTYEPPAVMGPLPETISSDTQFLAADQNPGQVSLLLSSTSIIESVAAVDKPMQSEEERCCRLPPPDRAESTTRCRDAYDMIQSQNYAGLETSVIISQLRPGFRGPVSDGEGCRVENRTLFAVLDRVLA